VITIAAMPGSLDRNLGLHSPMYMIISMGMDGDWNKRDGYSAQPDAHATMVVQFVKSYQ
jgi:hypothetical protein